MKTVFRLLGAAALFVVLVFAFGYFDPALTDERRWLGCGLIVASMATAWPAVLRLAEDWPRMKPKHNVELAFAQIFLGVAALAIACLMGGRVSSFMEPLVKPTPIITAPGTSGPGAGISQSLNLPEESSDLMSKPVVGRAVARLAQPSAPLV